MKKLVLAVLILLSIWAGALAQKSAVFNPAEGAIHGYDPVAYFKESKPVKGDSKFSLTWNAATWYFASQQNMEAFKANPEKYAPQYGGYCAFGMADGHKAPTDPEAWTIINNKLYLNYNRSVQQSWKKNTEGYIVTADKKWPGLKDKE